MDWRIKAVDQRLPMASTMLMLFRMLAKTYLKVDRFAGNADEVLLCCGVFIGQAEQRPLNVSKLSQFAGIARPTAIRKLKTLHQRGILEINGKGFYCLPIHALNGHDAMQCFKNTRKALVMLGDHLSRMDTKNIAADEA